MLAPVSCSLSPRPNDVLAPHLAQWAARSVILFVLPLVCSAQYTKSITVVPNLQVNAFTIWYEMPGGSALLQCVSAGTGAFTVTTNPKHGTATPGSGNLVASCSNGIAIPAAIVYYTWTDTTTTATTDSFAVSYRSSDGTQSATAAISVSLGVAQQTKLLGNRANSCTCVSPAAGEPIDIASGNVSYQVTDYQTVGQNPLRFTRTYNSRAASSQTFAATLGVNWRSNYDRYLRLQSASAVIAERQDGQQLNFALSGGAWTADSDVDLALTQSGTGVGSTWVLTDSTDTVETYLTVNSTEAILKSVQSRNGYTQTLSYDSTNHLTSITDSYSRTLTLAYANNLLQSVATPDSLVLTYAYAAAPGGNQLTSVSYSTTPATSQTYSYSNYSNPFGLTGITDENANSYTTWTYDTIGRGLTSQHGAGADLTTVAYNDKDGSRTVTNALGLTETYHYITLQGVPKVTEIDRPATQTSTAAKELFAYDNNGYLASQTDWNGNQTIYVNNAHGQPTTITEAAGTSAARTRTIAYDSTWVHLPASVAEPGITTSFTYDSSGEVLTKTQADTTTGAVPYPTNGQTRTWTYTWSNFLLSSALGPRTDAQELTKFTYDSTGALTATTNALGQATKITQHLPGGLPQTIVDANGVSTSFTYDARQRLMTSAITTAAGVLTTKFALDAAGQLLTTTLPDGSALTNKYDAAHRLIGVTDLFKQSIAYSLDPLGDQMQVDLIDSSGNTQRYHNANFDALGRTYSDIGGAVGENTEFFYDSNSNITSILDPLNHTTRQAFDALNRPVTTTDAAGNVTTTIYDAHDRPLSVIDPNGGTTAYTYDGFGDVIQQISSATGTTVFHYDPAGNLTQRIDSRGVIANYTYDALDRVKTVVYPGGTSENVTYTRDESGHGFGVGRLTSLTDAVGTLSRSYDERGDIISETRGIGTTTLNIGYTFDAAQRVASIVYPSGSIIAYSRDAMGRVTGVSAQAPGTSSKPLTILSGITYQPFGPVTGMTFGNNIKESRAFDLDYRLTALTDSGKTPFQNLGYRYDAASNVFSINDGVTSANNQTFGYDPLNRLTSATGAYGKLAYVYDALGNRLSDTATPPAASPDGLAGITAVTYGQSGRASTVTAGTQQLAGYAYDAFSQRLSRTGATSALYQYDQSGRLIEEMDGQGNPQADYLYLDYQPIASLSPSSGKVYFLLDDRLGTPQVATDTNQTVMWSASYQPFGATGTSVGLITQDLRLPGQEYDSMTGWNHNGFREYVPVWGRYSQGDPIGLLGGMNAYAYASQNPSQGVDPTGLLTVITYVNGNTQQVSTASELVQAITTAGSGSIQKIVFAGHAYQLIQGIGDDEPAAEALEIDSSGRVIVRGPSPMATGQYGPTWVDFGQLVNGKMASNATIELTGCDAGAEHTSAFNPTGYNIANATSRVVPGVPVSASALPTLGPRRWPSTGNWAIPFSTNTYINGQKY